MSRGIRMGCAVAVAMVAIVCGPSAGARAAEKADLATLVFVFDQMVLREQGRISKWTPGTRNLTIKVTAKFGERESGVLDASLAVLAEHANLKVVRNDDAEKPDFLIETTKTLKSHPGIGQRYIGMTNSTWGRLGSEMRLATIQIIEDWYRNDPYAIHRTIPHELMHALGFHGHPQLFDSALSIQNTRNSLSEWDLFFMRVLYDPKLPVGTPRVFALPLVCRLMHERLIAEANSDVTDLNRNGPHPYCEQLQAQRDISAKTPFEELRLAWAYLRGFGVEQNVAEAERWAQKALAGKDPDAQNLINLIEKFKLAKSAPPASSTKTPLAALAPAAFKPPPVDTVFVLSNKDSLKVVRVDAETVHTVTSKDIPYRWAGLFFGRNARVPVSQAETTAAGIWPLSTGKSIEFEHSGIEDGLTVIWKNTITVLGTESLKIDGKNIMTYVVERRSTRLNQSPGEELYEAVYTFWYAPELGFHARYRSQFKGKTAERPVNWTLTQVVPRGVP